MKSLTLTTSAGQTPAFAFSEEELQDLCFAMSVAIADSESFLNSHAPYMSIADQMRQKRRIDRFYNLLEQFNRGEAYDRF